jgi:hypothetical protein
MTVDEMSRVQNVQMLVDEINLNEMPIDKILVDNMSVDVMFLHQMSFGDMFYLRSLWKGCL